MDERLEAGRHHLANGDLALRQGYPDDGRAHFEAALLQFRGPELRLGEAHALRGLGRVELGLGNLRRAKDRADAAVNQYQELGQQLSEIDPSVLSSEMRREAIEGEAGALMLLGEVLVRQGKGKEAREAYRHARAAAQQLGDVALVADVWSALGRLAMRYSDYDNAADHLENARRVYEKVDSIAGQVRVWLLVSELHRLRGKLDEAESALNKARPLSRKTGSDRLNGRVLYSLGVLMSMQVRLRRARGYFEEALPLVRAAGDTEMEGYCLLGLGDAESQAGDGSALENLVDGARALGSIGHQHGLSTALLRIGEHGLRIEEPALALAASVGAFHLFQVSDPVRGVGQALRLVVKALAALKHWPAALTAALTREAIAGSNQPNAKAVARFYRERAPKPWLAELEGLSTDELVRRCVAYTDRVLRPTLALIKLTPDALKDVMGALSVIEALATRLPQPLPDEAFAPVTGSTEPVLPADTADAEELGSEADLVGAPDEDPAEAQALAADAGSETSVVTGPQPEHSEVPESAEPVESAAPEEYSDAYDPPVTNTSDVDDDSEEVQIDPALKKAAPPGEYADFYDAPSDGDGE